MSIYFIEAQTGRFELTSTSSISKTMTGKLTDNPVESGSSLSDNYVQMPDSFTIEGIITDVGAGLSVFRTESHTGTLIKALTEIKEKNQTFTFHFGDVIAESLNCMFESIAFSQDKVNGNARGRNSFKVKLGFRQVLFAQKALQTNKREELVDDKLQEEESTSQATQSKEDALDQLQISVDEDFNNEVNRKNKILKPNGD